MTKHVKDIDRGWKKIKQGAAKGNGLYVAVGILDDKTDRDDGELTNAYIGSIHEFGYGHNPERSFLRTTVDRNSGEYARFLTKNIKFFMGKIEDYLSHSLSLLGLKVKTDIVKTINSGIPPANSEITIDRKGSTIPLIDTGALKASIDWAIRK